MDQTLFKAVLQKVEKKDNRKCISCQDAFAIAKDFDVEPAAIGRICHNENIKIGNCQLGFF